MAPGPRTATRTFAEGAAVARRDVRDEVLHDLLITAVERPEGLRAALRRAGEALGAAGYGLDEVAAEVQRLAGGLPDPHAEAIAALARFDAGAALAEGWSTGFLHGLHDDWVRDPASGLSTTSVLEHRLVRQVTDTSHHREGTGVMGAGREVLVIDVHLDHDDPLVREAGWAAIGHLVAERAVPNGTAARVGDRVVVVPLAPVDGGWGAWSDDLRAALDGHPLVGRGATSAWWEAMPVDVEQVPAFLADLADLAG